MKVYQCKEKCPRIHVSSSSEGVQGLLMKSRVSSKRNCEIKIHSSYWKASEGKVEGAW